MFLFSQKKCNFILEKNFDQFEGNLKKMILMEKKTLGDLNVTHSSAETHVALCRLSAASGSKTFTSQKVVEENKLGSSEKVSECK